MVSDSDRDNSFRVDPDLVSLIAPPPSGASEIDWSRVEGEYGQRLPVDYIDFMRIYGEGLIDNFLSIYPPFPDAYPNDPDSTIRGITEEAIFTAENEGYSHPEGLVGWGLTVDSDLLCWRRSSADPDDWGTVIWRRQWAPPQSWIEFDCGMAELLGRYARREIPDFHVDGLRFGGTRFVGARDLRRFRAENLDPWGPEPLDVGTQ